MDHAFCLCVWFILFDRNVCSGCLFKCSRQATLGDPDEQWRNCCDSSYGEYGNVQCWDTFFTYARCCSPREEFRAAVEAYRDEVVRCAQTVPSSVIGQGGFSPYAITAASSAGRSTRTCVF